jgi:MFS family permease
VHTSQQDLPPHYRRNFAAFLVEYVFFDLSISFVGFTSVVPTFLRQLTDSAPLVGLATTLFHGGFQWPQALFAHLTRRHLRKKPIMMWGAIGRVFLWLVALALWAGLGRYPAAMLALFLLGISIFALTDSLVTVQWFEVMARAIPSHRRGRLFGLAQVISGVAGIGVGTLVGRILSASYRRPLTGYALLFTLSGAAMLVATVALALIKEPAPEEVDPEAHTRASWLSIVARDPAFRRFVLCRLLLSGVDLATPFYVVHAQDALRLPASRIGAFVIAQTLGAIAGSVLFGAASERWGSRAVTRAASLLAPAGPLLALVIHLSGGGWPVLLYPLIFAVLGVMYSAWILGFINYSQDIAPEGLRPAYVGLTNTIFGLTTLMPTLGGWLLQSFSYTVLFASAAALGALGTLTAVWLKPTPKKVHAEPELLRSQAGI